MAVVRPRPLSASTALRAECIGRKVVDWAASIGGGKLLGPLSGPTFGELEASHDWSTTLQMHQNRVGAFSKLVAQHMGLYERHAAAIAEAAALHDIGKLLVPAAYLHKPCGLTEAELAIVRQHTVWGHAILARANMTLAATVALQHHERWDGGGYPNGLAGDQIALEARITAICDVYDALREDRPYHRGMSHDAAVHVIECGDGRVEPGMFDPLVLKSFLESSGKLLRLFLDVSPEDPRTI